MSSPFPFLPFLASGPAIATGERMRNPSRILALQEPDAAVSDLRRKRLVPPQNRPHRYRALRRKRSPAREAG